MKRKQTLFRLTLVIAVLASVSIAMAVIPPPPADQNLGLYDTVCSEFNESDCRSCHSSGVPDAHHLLVEAGEYGCTDCHPPGPDGGVTVTRDCTVCHTSTPHHNTTAARARHCSECHGSFVDDYDDGHYIPTYDVSLITPNTTYREINATTGKKWGGCEACHEPDLSMSPTIESNPDTHHTAVSNMTCGEGNNICHFDPIANIRKCEDCHGVNSIHNIQYDYNNTKGELGYGHIGDNWDCMGCHGWYEYKALPVDPVITPHVDMIKPGKLVAGKETVVTITGTDLMTTVGDTTYTSDVVVEGDGEDITLEPDSITATKIVVTIPGQDEGTHGVYVRKSELRSNMVPIVVAPEVKIESAIVNADGSVKIIGEGFGEYIEGFSEEELGVTIEFGGRFWSYTFKNEVMGWNDTTIVVKCTQRPIGTVNVRGVYGENSARLATNPDAGR